MSHKNIAWVICWLLSVGLIVKRQQSVFPAGFTLNSLSYQVPNIPACCLLILESRAWNMGIHGPEGKVELGHLYGCDSISLGTISRGPDWEGKRWAQLSQDKILPVLLFCLWALFSRTFSNTASKLLSFLFCPFFLCFWILNPCKSNLWIEAILKLILCFRSSCDL